eukprot:6045909-Pyramimonas_sp.AAC.1
MPRGVASILGVGSTQRKGPPVEASWSVLGAPWRSQRPLEASWVLRGASWGLLGFLGESLGGLLGASWGLLGPPGRVLRPS